jgi:hypothetical protein
MTIRRPRLRRLTIAGVALALALVGNTGLQ